MYLSITSTAHPATDLGFLLHKHPERPQSTSVSMGEAHVFYPEASEERCTVALLVEIDPVALARGRGRREPAGAQLLGQYVNDRPYAASSMLAVALGKVFRTALAGRCDARPELVGVSLPLEVRVPALPAPHGPGFVRDLFEPLGWTVETTEVPLDATQPAWGSRHVDLRLTGEQVLAQALSHLYVLLPVLDGGKHYWVSDEEVDKIVRTAGDWLGGHPMREVILRRALAHQRRLVDSALERLAELDGLAPATVDQVEDPVTAETDGEARPLVVRRHEAVLSALREAGAHRVVDLGCGPGALLRELLADPSFTEVVGADVSATALAAAERRLRLDSLPDRQRERLSLLQSSVTYRDERLAGYDAVVLMEVVEHVDPDRLPALEDTVFAAARPRVVVLTTPNAEHNVRFAGLAPGAMRHADHRFEWSRSQLRDWAEGVASRHGYAVGFHAVGDDDAEVGPPTQLAVFTRTDAA